MRWGRFGFFLILIGKSPENLRAHSAERAKPLSLFRACAPWHSGIPPAAGMCAAAVQEPLCGYCTTASVKGQRKYRLRKISASAIMLLCSELGKTGLAHDFRECSSAIRDTQS